MKLFSLPAHLPASRTLRSAIRNQQSISTNFRKNPRLIHFRHRIFSAISFNFPPSIIKFRRETEWIDILRKPEIDANEVDERWERKRRRGRIFFSDFVRLDNYSPECILCSIITKAIKNERASASLLHDACTCRWPNAKKCCLRREGRD